MRLSASAAAALAALSALLAGCGDPPATNEAGSRPNVLVVMTDDQDTASLAVMDEVRDLIADKGVSFANSFVSLPLCCPSRASFLTGRYAHNHGVLLADPDPSRREYRDKARRLESSTLPIWLQRAGYRTALIGKYLNGYGSYDRTEIPPGWDHWVSPVGERSIYGYYDFTLNEDGRLVNYSGADSYQTDVLTDQAVDYISEAAGGPDPFFLDVAYVAPHIGEGGSADCEGSARPAERDLGALADEPLPQPPSFGEDDVSDKPRYVQRLPDLDQAAVDEVARTHRCRLESLLAVDDGVKRLMGALDDAGELDDTVIVFTSDNGWLEGQHRLRASKFFPYEESLRVPLIVRGAGGEPGSSVEAPALNVDLAPTILALAGARPDRALDGTSLLPALGGGSLPRRDLLFEGYYNNAHTGGRTLRYYSAIRRGELQYTEYATGERELYDLATDPSELDNRDGDPQLADQERALAAALGHLRRCAGSVDDRVNASPPCY